MNPQILSVLWIYRNIAAVYVICKEPETFFH